MAHVAGHEVGRISGPLLKTNLQRTSDLAFETDLLYIAHTNGKIGIKDDAPAFDLSIAGTTYASAGIIATNLANLGNFTVNSTGFNAPTGDITIGLVDGNGNPKAGDIVMNELRTASLSFTNSTISSSDDIVIQPGPGTGIFRIPTDLKSYGDIHATGDITFDGNLLISGDDASEDTITIGGELDSNLVPDQTLTYDLGSNTQRWGHIYTNRILDLNDVAIQGDLSFNGIAVNLGIVNKWYVSTNGIDSSPGDHPNFAFATIKRAIQAVEESTAGPHEIHILAGEYEEEFPLEIPMNTTIKGFSLRSVTVKPTVATQNKDAFLLNEASLVSDLTVKDFYYDSGNDTGYAFRFAPNAALIGKSPYVQNATVLTKGSTITVADPRGFDSGDAGKGVLLDASTVDPSSYSASMLFNAVTFITPGVDAVTVKNGSRMEFIDCFTYFAGRGVYMEHTLNQYTPSAGTYDPATGVMTLTIGNHTMREGETITIANDSLTFTCAMDGHATDHTYPRSTDPYSGRKVTITETTATTFTCNVGVSSNTTAHLFKSATANSVTEGSMNEVRSIASAFVYGNKGIEADGNGCLAYLISHNFAYIGVGKDVTNDISLVNQFAEVLESNGAKVTFVSQDQGSDFRVGNNFFVDASKGTTSIDITNSELTGSSLTIGRNNITFIDATKIETGNFRISNNTIQSLVNEINVSSAGGTINFNSNVSMQKNVTVSNNATIGGTGINFGNDSNDVVDFSMDINQDLIPSTDGAHNLGTINRQWKKINNTKTVIEDVEIHNNNITAWNTNQDLNLRGSGTGFVKVADLNFKTNISTSSSDVVINSNTKSTIINSTDALGLPIGTTGQDPAQAQSLRFNTSLGNFVSYTTGSTILSGVTDFDKDTYISTASNQYTFFADGTPTAQITGAGTLDAIAVSSNNQTKLDGNTITVGSNGGQGGVTANGTGRVLFDSSEWEIGNSDWYVTGTNSDFDFEFTGIKRNTYLHFDTTKAAIMPLGAQAVRPVTARQGELWWNQTTNTLEVYTGTEWVTSVGSQEITVTEAFAEELNVLYELILS